MVFIFPLFTFILYVERQSLLVISLKTTQMVASAHTLLLLTLPNSGSIDVIHLCVPILTTGFNRLSNVHRIPESLLCSLISFNSTTVLPVGWNKNFEIILCCFSSSVLLFPILLAKFYFLQNISFNHTPSLSICWFPCFLVLQYIVQITLHIFFNVMSNCFALMFP